MENESRVDDIYFRCSAESVVIRRPHTQYVTPGLQWLRQNLHCHFGSVLTISEISMFAFFDRPLRLSTECIEWLFFVQVVLDGLLLWVICDSPNQLKNFKVFGTFHRFFRNTRDTEVNIRIVRCKVKLVHCITTFEMIVFLHCVLYLLSFRFPWVVVILDMLFFPWPRSPWSVGKTWFFLQHTNNLLSYGFPRTIFIGFWGLGWLGRIKLNCFSKVTVEQVSLLVDVQL